MINEITPNAYGFIRTEGAAMMCDRAEIGGFLLGYMYTDGSIKITHAMGPGPKAQRKWNLFVADVDYANDQARSIMAQDSMLSWVGHWHTHPHDHPWLTPPDIIAGNDAVAERKTECPWIELLALIDPDGLLVDLKAFRFVNGSVHEPARIRIAKENE